MHFHAVWLDRVPIVPHIFPYVPRINLVPYLSHTYPILVPYLSHTCPIFHMFPWFSILFHSICSHTFHSMMYVSMMSSCCFLPFHTFPMVLPAFWQLLSCPVTFPEVRWTYCAQRTLHHQPGWWRPLPGGGCGWGWGREEVPPALCFPSGDVFLKVRHVIFLEILGFHGLKNQTPKKT